MNATITQLIAIGFGGAIGSMLRFVIAMIWRSGSPLGTLTVNLLGSLLLGFLVAASLLLGELKPHWRLMITVGFCGGFTTFSTFSVQTMELLQTGRWWIAIGNICANVIGCVLLSFLGYWIGKTLFTAV